MELESVVDIVPCELVLPCGWETSVFNIAALAQPWPASYVYVGHGPRGCGLNPSPWGSPYASSALCDRCPYDDRFLRYAEARADLLYWLRPLVGKVWCAIAVENAMPPT